MYATSNDYHHHQSVLPKRRSFTSKSGIKAAVLPKARFSTANFGTKVAVLLGMNSCGSFPLLFAPHSLSLASEQTLKYPSGTKVEVRRVDLANWALRTSTKYTTGVKFQFRQGFRPDQRSGIPKHLSPQ